jgi:hypothetical protein
MAPRQDAVAVQDFGPAYDRYGSIAPDQYAARRRGMSASRQKRTNSGQSRYVR